MALIENGRDRNYSIKVMYNNSFCCFSTLSKLLAMLIISSSEVLIK